MNQRLAVSTRCLLGRIACASALVVATAVPAGAAPFSLTISGTIAGVESSLDTGGAFAPGDTFSLTYTVDSASPDLDAQPWAGSYYQFAQVSRVDIRLGTWMGSGLSGGGGAILSANDNPPSSPEVAGWDIYQVFSFSEIGHIGDPFGEFWFNAFLFSFADSSGTAFTSDALVQPGLDASDFDKRYGWIGFNTDSDTADVDLIVDSISVQTVPEPSSIALIGLGLAGAGWYKRRARR